MAIDLRHDEGTSGVVYIFDPDPAMQGEVVAAVLDRRGKVDLDKGLIFRGGDVVCGQVGRGELKGTVL